MGGPGSVARRKSGAGSGSSSWRGWQTIARGRSEMWSARDFEHGEGQRKEAFLERDDRHRPSWCRSSKGLGTQAVSQHPEGSQSRRTEERGWSKALGLWGFLGRRLGWWCGILAVWGTGARVRTALGRVWSQEHHLLT